MFSVQEKKEIARKIEELLLELSHPEMPDEKLKFLLQVHGKEPWSWANIEPNWFFEDGKEMGYNPFNEISRAIFKNKQKEEQAAALKEERKGK